MCKFADEQQIQRKSTVFQTTRMQDNAQENEFINRSLTMTETSQTADLLNSDPKIIQAPAFDNEVNQADVRIKIDEPVTFELDYKDIESRSEIVRQGKLIEIKSQLDFLSRNPLYGDDIKELVEDIRIYLDTLNTAADLNAGKAKDGYKGFKWLFHSFSKKSRFKRKTSAEKLNIIQKKIKKLYLEPQKESKKKGKISQDRQIQENSVRKAILNWYNRMTESGLEYNPADVYDATETRYIKGKKIVKNSYNHTQGKKVSLKDRRSEPLFPSEPSVRDVAQGGIGDCYFISAIASVVNDNPDAIREMMKDEGDSVVVRMFFNRRKMGENVAEPVYIRVTKDVPQDYAHDSLWVQILEKAFAVATSMRSQMESNANAAFDKNMADKSVNYNLISGGDPGYATFALTGHFPEAVKTSTNEKINNIGSLYKSIGQHHMVSKELKALKQEFNKKYDDVTPTVEKKIAEYMATIKDYDAEFMEDYDKKIKRYSELQFEINKREDEGEDVPDDDPMNVELDQIMAYQRSVDDKFRKNSDIKAASKVEIDKIQAWGEAEKQRLRDELQQSAAKYGMSFTVLSAQGDMAYPKDFENAERLKNCMLPQCGLLSTGSTRNYDKYLQDTIATILDKAAKKAGADNLHGTRKKAKNGEQSYEYQKTATIEDYEEAIPKIMEVLKSDMSLYDDPAFDLKLYFREDAKQEALNALQSMAVFSLNYVKTNLQNQALIGHEPLSDKYTEFEKKTFNDIKQALSEKKVVTFGTKENAKTNQAGLNNESLGEGLYDNHAYSILNVKEIGSRKFVVARNPWGYDIVKYNKNAAGGYDMQQNDNADNGIGLIEFNHFMQRVDSIYF